MVDRRPKRPASRPAREALGSLAKADSTDTLVSGVQLHAVRDPNAQTPGEERGAQTPAEILTPAVRPAAPTEEPPATAPAEAFAATPVDPVTAQQPAQAAEPVIDVPVQPTTPDLPAATGWSPDTQPAPVAIAPPQPAPASEAPPSQALDDKPAPKQKFTVQLDAADAERFRSAWANMPANVRPLSMSDMIAEPLMQRVREVEEEYNGGEPWPPLGPGRVRTGRPAKY
ncbi:hypothetical protein GCM10022262_39220 [Georgenia daeguensis]|uniref:Centromere-binding protein ParB C-terminal domain-containing protein n=1 Tax=Georgenia daeguensis TaxID=908355 RepID=A0ABP6ULJ6_9MICO